MAITRRRSSLLRLVPAAKPLKASLPTVLPTIIRIHNTVERIALHDPAQLALVERAIAYIEECLIADVMPQRQFR